MNLLGIYTIGVTQMSLQMFTARHSNRKLSIVMALSTTFTQCTPETTKFGKITQNKAILPFKVTDFDTNQKLIYDFLSAINTNLLVPAILYSLRDIAF